MRGFRRSLVFAVITLSLASACAGGTGGGGGGSGPLTKVRLQLQWVAQSQFAGYYAAAAKGYYKDAGLEVEIKLGGPDIVPQQVVASDGAEFGIAWVPKMLASREAGADLVNIAQVFQRSGTLEVSFKDKNITAPEQWKGKKVGTWGFGNEPELYAAMRKVGIDPNKASDVTIVKQPFDMSLLLNGEVDAAQAMIYNEYAQVLEQKNPKTGKLYQPDELNVIDFNKVGTAMLQDHLFARDAWLKKSGNEDIATRFLQASFKGWVFCRDSQKECVDIVLKAGTTLGKGHMTWQLNEINALIWPSPSGIGAIEKASWDQTVSISTTYQILKGAPSGTPYRTDLAKKAADALKGQGVDINGASFKKAVVEVTAGGN
ncbi:MAG: ABC transporter substrate-binding protein [Chloroflexi bacterium]|nr:MAG: ABC transporter substrate-binding protein [Chloroflexota bacterium]